MITSQNRVKFSNFVLNLFVHRTFYAISYVNGEKGFRIINPNKSGSFERNHVQIKTKHLSSLLDVEEERREYYQTADVILL